MRIEVDLRSEAHSSAIDFPGVVRRSNTKRNVSTAKKAALDRRSGAHPHDLNAGSRYGAPRIAPTGDVIRRPPDRGPVPGDPNEITMGRTVKIKDILTGGT